ncbi:hypothetical protein MPTK1_1g13540 [Marchantia polymorpha subsp. ruderalis]|uniref:DUF547 domain-containing protein n=2 Tax=Marchantia polymorpha TaxID=3197 RepID=A0AAF6APR7_MARPO|nr:hypothetical protein MARPO_0019s0124 [Marchantia polymorpha]BBM98437.1 hypothetical protein Mp_1g13540 [Marchantia polymorpha subsp. ruderalis]|eukprot:PTQ44707.1 hypothetical protein MARPO_0019s0124 [Marchantia polymorpha]
MVMKDSQEAAGSQPDHSPPESPYGDKPSRPPHGRSNSLLLLQFRTELEGKWRPDKLGIARRWMNVSPKQWFCQKEDVFEFSMRPSMIIRNASSTCQRQARKKQKARGNAAPKAAHSERERFAEHGPRSEESDKFIDYAADLEVKRRNERKARRLLLEEEVMMLQKRLYKEMDLHLSLETALDNQDGGFSQASKDLPTSAKELLADIASLEEVVADLEERAAILEYQIVDEQKEREDIEQSYAVSKGVLQRSSSSLLLTSSSSMATSLAVSPVGRKVAPAGPESQVTSPAPRQGLLTLQEHLRLSSDDCDQSPPLSVYRESPASKKGGMGRCSEKHVRFSPSVTTIQKVSPLLLPETFARSPLNSPTQPYFRTEYPHTCPEEPMAQEPGSPRGSRGPVQSSTIAKDSDFSFPYSPSRYSPSSPARHSFSGISSDRSGSCAQTCLEQDLASLPTSSPPTPEHRVRPTSPANFDDLRFLCDSPSESYVKELSEIRPSTEHSNSWSKSSDEFHSPQTSSSLGDYLSGESKPPSAEKPRCSTKFRVKMNLQEEFSSVKSRKAFTISRGENSMGPLFPPTVCPVECVVDGDDQFHFRDYSQTPNLLSEEMVRCMISIYCHLADPAVVTPPVSSYDNLPSPTSPLGHVTSSSLSSFSESSLLSFVRSPLVDLRSKEEIWGNENTFDPYKARGRIPWADLGAYSKVLEVLWMSVRKDQLGYAAQALQRFRSLVEQLPAVDPRGMSHTEKLAFWINLYNALMMHAYLAYGIPRNDLKYFSLLQKAAYNVGGHSFNAATIEFSLLRGRPPSYRPQIVLLMALHRNKFHLTEEQSSYAIDYPEPQTVFALCCGARSSPAVRIYTAGCVNKELNLALRDYARASVGLSAKGKLLVPKLLYTYARDVVEDAAILDWICQLLPANQASLILEFWQQRQSRLLGARKFEVMAFDFNFRYLFAHNFEKPVDAC